MPPASAFAVSGTVKGRIILIEIAFLAEGILRDSHRLGKALVVYDFPRAQELDHIVDIRVVAQTEDVVVRDARLLLWYIIQSTFNFKFLESPMNFNRYIPCVRDSFTDRNIVNQGIHHFSR